MEKRSIRGKLILTFSLIMAGLFLLLICILIPERVIHDRTMRVERISMIASLLGEDEAVQKAIANGQADEELIHQLDDCLEKYHVDFIVLAQLDGRRVYHPEHERIGEYFVGGDEKRIQEGEDAYISIARGTANKQQRAFYRVVSDGKPVGFVMVSLAMSAILYEQYRLVFQLLLVVLLIFAIGFFAFDYILKNMQKTLLGYEPEEFANIYTQGEQTLRASTHEFLNKMHVVSGLLQMENYQDALHYIGEVTEELEETQGAIVRNIENPTISALLLGKFSRARELDIQFMLRKDSTLRRHTPYLSTNDMITVIGNLIENAFDAVKNKKNDRVVEIFIGDSENGLSITVDDSGLGMTPEQVEMISHKSFTTKGKGHGIGLKLIRGIVQRRQGFLEIESEPGEGSSFTVSFDKVRGEDL